MSVKQEHVIDRQGKKMVLYAGLLDEAHEKGLVGISTDLVQVPNESNGNVAISTAVVDMGDGKTFSGIGDASPANVGRMIAPHIIRMAETRAKARALRDAINAGDLDIDGDEPVEEAPRQQSARSPRPAEATGDAASSDAPRATKQQAESIKNLAASRWPGGVDGLENRLGCAIGRLEKSRAKDVLDHLNQMEVSA